MKQKWFGLLLALAVANTIAGCSHPRSNSGQSKVDRSSGSRPAEQLGDRVWGIACLSVASAREQPEHKAEMATQVLMGNTVRVLKSSRIWYYVETGDGYRAWLEKGTFVRCTHEQVEAWNRSPLLIVTAFEERILEQPNAQGQPVSDVVLGDLLKKSGEENDWFKV